MANRRQPSITLRYALLGLLARRPLTGWEILKRFRRSLVFFWHAERSQIYAELNRLERQGLVSSQVAAAGPRPARRRYEITEAGRTALHAWLDRPTAAQPIKDEMLLRTFFAEHVVPERAAAYLRAHGDEHRRILAEFEAIRAALGARYGDLEAADDRALALGSLVLEQGIRFERMYAEWCDWAAGVVERRRPERAGTGGSPDLDFILTC